MKRNFARRDRKRLSPSSYMVSGADNMWKLAAALFLAGFLLSHTPSSAAELQVSLTLSDAIRMAEDHSYGVKAGRFDSASAAFDYRAVRSQQYPTLSLSAVSFYYNKLQKLELPFMSKEIGSKENYQSDFRLTQLLFTGGKISNQTRIQEAITESRTFNLKAMKLETAYLTRRAYLNLLMSISLVESAKASLNRVEIIRNDVDNLFRVGMADSVDILDAETARQNGLQILAEKETARKNASIILAQLTGLSSDLEIIPIESLTEPTSDQLPGGQPIAPKINRPELNALDSRIRSANLLIGLNKAAYVPNLSGYVGYSVGMPNRDQFNQTWNDYFTAGLALSWEFNLGGKVNNGALSARNTLFSAQMARSKLEESLLMQRDITVENLKYSYQAYLIAKEQFNLSTNKFRLAKERQKMGRMTVNRILELEAELAATEQFYKASIINYYLSDTEYMYANGSEKIYGGL